jgi:hypothetical protein
MWQERGVQSLSFVQRPDVHLPLKQTRPEPQSEFHVHSSLPGPGQRSPSRGHEIQRHTPPTQPRSSAVPAVSSSPRQLLLALHSRLAQAPSMQAASPPQSLSVVQPPALHWLSTHD